jgi:hypothetical protein
MIGLLKSLTSRWVARVQGEAGLRVPALGRLGFSERVRGRVQPFSWEYASGERVVLKVKTKLPPPQHPCPFPLHPPLVSQPLEFTSLCSSSTLVNGHCSGEKDRDVFGLNALL